MLYCISIVASWAVGSNDKLQSVIEQTLARQERLYICNLCFRGELFGLLGENGCSNVSRFAGMPRKYHC